jgi:hypothetical protein
MPDLFRPDEALRNESIELAMAGDYIGVRHTAATITTRQYLREVWMCILFIQRDLGDVDGIKQTIVSCPDQSLLRSHEYSRLPVDFLERTGNRTGAIEIAETMGSHGFMSMLILLTPFDLLDKGNYAGAKDAVASIKDEEMRRHISHFVDVQQRKRNDSGQQLAAPNEGDDIVARDVI